MHVAAGPPWQRRRQVRRDAEPQVRRRARQGSSSISSSPTARRRVRQRLPTARPILPSCRAAWRFARLAGGRHFAPERDGADRSDAPPPAPPKKEAAPPPAPKEASAAESKEKPPSRRRAQPKRRAPPPTKGKGAKNEKNDKSDQADKSARPPRSPPRAPTRLPAKMPTRRRSNSDDADSKDDKAGGDAADANKLDSVSKLAGHRVGIVTGNEATRGVLDVVLSHYGVPLDQVQVSQIDPSTSPRPSTTSRSTCCSSPGRKPGRPSARWSLPPRVNGQAPSFIPIDQAEGMAKRSRLSIRSTSKPARSAAIRRRRRTTQSLIFPEYLVARIVAPRRDRDAGEADLFIATALAAAMPGEIKIRGARDREGRQRRRASWRARLSERRSEIVLRQIRRRHLLRLADLSDLRIGDRRRRRLFPQQRPHPAAAAAAASHRSHAEGHARPSLEALDQLQVDVDHLVVAIIHQTEQEEYDEAMQASFGLALDQVRFAIASRRTVLLEHGGSEAKPGAKAAAA